MDDEFPQTNRQARFQSTHWSLIAQAADPDSPNTHEALSKLCENYWFPLYAYIRRKGHSHADALDLTQGYFERLLSKNYIAAVDRSKGRFRTFLLVSLEHFLAKEWNRAHRQKRGGGQTIISLDAVAAEERYRIEPQDNRTPAQIFDYEWALAVLNKAMARLGAEYESSGKGGVFHALNGFLSGEAPELPQEEIGQKLGMSAGAVAVALHRMRKRYGEILRAEITDTLTDRADLNQELQTLFAALRPASR